MGAWGTSIQANDTYADVFAEFFELFDQGMEVEAISQKLIAENQETVNDSDDCNNFWFALAKAQWECKGLDPVLLERVNKIIESGEDIRVWQNLDADEKDIRKRRIALDKFLETLLSEKSKARIRKKKIIREPLYRKGDCLTFKLANGNYGGAVVLDTIRGSEYPYMLIATTRINSPVTPILADFINAKVLILSRNKNWKNKPNIHWMLFSKKEVQDTVAVVGNIDARREYSISNSGFGCCFKFDSWVIYQANEEFAHENTFKSLFTKTIKIKNLI